MWARQLPTRSGPGPAPRCHRNPGTTSPLTGTRNDDVVPELLPEQQLRDYVAAETPASSSLAPGLRRL